MIDHKQIYIVDLYHGQSRIVEHTLELSTLTMTKVKQNSLAMSPLGFNPQRLQIMQEKSRSAIFEGMCQQSSIHQQPGMLTERPDASLNGQQNFLTYDLQK